MAPRNSNNKKMEEVVTCTSIWYDMRTFPKDPPEFKAFYIRKMKTYMEYADKLRSQNRWPESIELIEMTYRFILHHFDRSRFMFNNNLIRVMIETSTRNRDQTSWSRHVAPGRRKTLYVLFDELRRRCEELE